MDVASRVRVGGIEYQGNHGLEHGRLPRGGRAERLVVSHDPALVPWHPISDRVGRRVGDHLGEGWLFVERKGPSVAFHYREAPDGHEARARIIAAVDLAMAEVRPEDGPGAMERFEGRKLVEVRPVGAGGKGSTFARLLGRMRPGAVVVLGDDRSDAEAFVAARAALASGALAASLAVGTHGAAETPPEMIAAADVVVAGPHVAARVLAALARALEREARPADRAGGGPAGSPGPRGARGRQGRRGGGGARPCAPGVRAPRPPARPWTPRR